MTLGARVAAVGDRRQRARKHRRFRAGRAGSGQILATPDIAGPAVIPNAAGSAPPPPAYVNTKDVLQYWGQSSATSKPAYGAGYADPLPLDICGYLPQQLQSAYGLTSQYANGVNGQGETVAIVDAYMSPTLLSDAKPTSPRNDPNQSLATSQFASMAARPFKNQANCGARGYAGTVTRRGSGTHHGSRRQHLVYGRDQLFEQLAPDLYAHGC